MVKHFKEQLPVTLFLVYVYTRIRCRMPVAASCNFHPMCDVWITFARVFSRHALAGIRNIQSLHRLLVYFPIIFNHSCLLTSGDMRTEKNDRWQTGRGALIVQDATSPRTRLRRVRRRRGTRSKPVFTNLRRPLSPVVMCLWRRDRPRLQTTINTMIHLMAGNGLARLM